MAQPDEVEKLSLLEKAVESAPEGIAILDQAHRFIFANQRYREVFGLADRRLRGENWRLAHPPHEHDFMASEVLRDLDIYGEWRGEVIAEDVSGATRVVDLAVKDVGQASAWFARVARRDRRASKGTG